MSEVRTNSITDAAGTGAPDFPNGLTTGVASFPDGTAAAPSITNTDDTNTGVFFPAADTVSIATGGAETMRIAAAAWPNGTVGIGTTSPTAYRLHLAAGSSGLGTVNPVLHVESSALFGSETSIQIASGGSASTIYFGVGGMTGSTRLVSTGATDGFIVQENSGGPISFSVGGERLRIASAGQLGIGGANYGTSGQVLTSGGSGAAPSWATPAAPTTAQVGSATAGLALGEVGTYAWLCTASSAATISEGSTYAGSGLFTAGLAILPTYTANGDIFGTYKGSARTGTWRAMGSCTRAGQNVNYAPSTVFLRIS